MVHLSTLLIEIFPDFQKCTGKTRWFDRENRHQLFEHSSARNRFSRVSLRSADARRYLGAGRNVVQLRG
jgi:hypothetical protein